MRALALGIVTAIAAALVIVVGAPLAAFAATTVSYSDEIGGTSVAAKATAESYSAPWKTAVTAAGGTASASIAFTSPTYTEDGPITGNIYTSPDGVTASVLRTKYPSSGAAPGAASTDPGTAACTGSGTQEGQNLQGAAPRPTSMLSGTDCLTGGGFAYTEFNGSAENTTRDAVEFSFTKPILAFGAWFGDLETRTTGGGIPAIVRLYNGATQIDQQNVVPTGSQTGCGSSATGCGNNTTRWIGFVADPAQPVTRMVVIVGDDDVAGTALNEGIGFIGAMMATMPGLTVTKTVAAGYPQNLGTGAYDIRYNLTVSNTGGTTVTGLGLVDNLATTFSPITAGSIGVQSMTLTAPTLSGSTAAVNPTAYNGTTTTQLLNTATTKLVAGDSLSIAVTVRVTPGTHLGPFSNTALAAGVSGTTAVSDAVDTPVSVTFTEAPVLAVTKTITSTVSNGDGTQTIGFSVKAENTGNVPLADLDLVDALATAFGPQFQSATVPVISIPPGSSSTVTVNAAFTGSDDSHLVLTDSSLATSDNVTLTFSAVIRATSASPGSNVVVATATSVGGQAVTASSTAPVTFIFTGAVKVSKVVSGGPGGMTDQIPFTVNCGTNGLFTPSVTLAGTTGSTTVNGIPALSTCSVAEGALPTAPAGYSWTGTSYSATSVSVVDGAVTEVAVTNTLTRDTGAVQLDVTITGGPVGGTTLSDPFTFSMTCGSTAYTPDVTVAASAGSSTTVGILAPSTCALVPGTPPIAPVGYSWGTPTLTPTSVSVTKNSTGVFTYSVGLIRDTGSIDIDLTIAGAPTAGFTGTFPFTVTCDTGGPYSSSAVLTTGNTSTTSITGIPAPATCLIAPGALPSPPAGYSWGATTATSPVTVVSGATTTATARFRFRLDLETEALGQGQGAGLAQTGAHIVTPVLFGSLLLMLGLCLFALGKRRAERRG